MEKIDDIPEDLPDEMFEDMLHSIIKRQQPGIFNYMSSQTWDPSDEEIEEWIDSLKEWDADEPTDPIGIPVTAHFDPEDIAEKRKREGLCPKCGDRGEWITGGCFCRNGHGQFMG